jgi:hypothetical protein
VPKIRIPLKTFLDDMKNGVPDTVLMSKYELTQEQLRIVFNRAVEKGIITQAEVDARMRSSPERGSEPRRTTAPGPRTRPPVPPTHPGPPLEQVRRPESRGILRNIPIFKILIVIFIVGFVLIVKFLPWWASVGIIIAGLAGIVWGGKFLFKRFFMGAFGAKGKVLAGADVTVHQIRPASPPTVEEEEEEEFDRSHDWYYLDVTITPGPSSGKFTHWEPGEMCLVGLDAKPEELEDEEHEVALISGCKVFADGEFREYEGEKYPGPQRIEYHVGVKPEVGPLQFRYYFELFGRVEF